ncbi:glycosyltransferase family 4 protein [Nocardiopsis sp. NRRL B-16309]|uniref:glycosyltransferase family 4 protein n=1 Tax=Nocardiopsis sp. NRRL B-16309 TaxID=1519494 RepID=UPI0006B02897|nr:glycosyltransferase family 4 protein [Nocardiopsis sp. NRRL B-16309]KOX15963.1 glycosyl transferase [Nocardiopsis sp. NRRL B-16309]
MGYARKNKKVSAAAATVTGACAIGVMYSSGVLSLVAAAQLMALGVIGMGTAAVMVWGRRVDRRVRDIYLSMAGGSDISTGARQGAGLKSGMEWRIAARAKEARGRAQGLYVEGRIQEAIEELAPYVVFDDQSDRKRRRLLSHRRAIGPLPALPERAPGVLPPVPGRVLHFVTNALPNTQAGYTVRTHRIVLAQREAGLQPHVVTFPGWPAPEEGDTEALREVDGIPYHRMRPGERFEQGLQERIDVAVSEGTALARWLRPAVLHAASDHKNATVALHVGRALGIPVVYEMRGFLEETWLSHEGAPSRRGSERHRLLVEREASVLRAADAVVTLADTMKAEIVERGVAPERIVLAPNAVDEHLLDKRPDGSAFRESFGIAEAEYVVGSVSSLTHYEGFQTLIEAAALLRDTGREIRVLLVGDGPARPDLLDLVERHGLGDLCLLPGRVDPDDALRAQAALDAMVVPRIDARVTRLVTPLKPVEAMALGVPVIASDLPALRELVVDGRAGSLVPPGDPAALADAIMSLDKNEESREERVRAGREEVASRRTWGHNAEIYRTLYGRLGALS